MNGILPHISQSHMGILTSQVKTLLDFDEFHNYVKSLHQDMRSTEKTSLSREKTIYEIH